jgi:hypothetical protein
MTPALKFKTFTTTEEFEQWQLDVDPKMHQIFPVPNYINGMDRPNQSNVGTPDGSDYTANLTYGLLVTYWITPPQGKEK